MLNLSPAMDIAFRAGIRFPRAWLEPPCASHSGVSRLMGLHYRSSHRRPFAIPAGVSCLHYKQWC